MAAIYPQKDSWMQSLLDTGTLNMFPKQRINTQQHKICWKECFMRGLPQGYIRRRAQQAEEELAGRETKSKSEVVVRQSPPGRAMGAGVPITGNHSIAKHSADIDILNVSSAVMSYLLSELLCVPFLCTPTDIFSKNCLSRSSVDNLFA
jgi:hypothetical protein